MEVDAIPAEATVWRDRTHEPGEATTNTHTVEVDAIPAKAIHREGGRNSCRSDDPEEGKLAVEVDAIPAKVACRGGGRNSCQSDGLERQKS